MGISVDPRDWQRLRGWLFTVALAFVIFVGTRAAVQSVQVEGASMAPTLVSGQHLLIDKTAYVFDSPRRGDIAVLRPPIWPNEHWIKRIVALPGDTVLVQDEVVLVNGAAVFEPYVRWPAEYKFPANGQPLAVPVGFYVVLGDNRPQSSDSHEPWFGLVPAENLVGRAWLAY